jgi:hypothetical protein
MHKGEGIMKQHYRAMAVWPSVFQNLSFKCLFDPGWDPVSGTGLVTLYIFRGVTSRTSLRCHVCSVIMFFDTLIAVV